MISSWHAHIAKQKLREEGEIEAEKNQNSGRTPPHFIVHASEHLRPPEMNRSQECRNRAADHDVMEMRDDEIGVMDMHVYGQQRSEEHTSELQSLMRISYAVFCLKKKIINTKTKKKKQ